MPDPTNPTHPTHLSKHPFKVVPDDTGTGDVLLIAPDGVECSLTQSEIKTLILDLHQAGRRSEFLHKLHNDILSVNGLRECARLLEESDAHELARLLEENVSARITHAGWSCDPDDIDAVYAREFANEDQERDREWIRKELASLIQW